MEKSINYPGIFDEIAAKLPGIANHGQVASYIPELANVDPDKFGMHLINYQGEHFSLGASDEKFSIQSIAKVLALTLAYSAEEETLWQRVGVEPSGNPFNSLVQLEYEQGIPRNPFINAGALLVSDILVSHLKAPKEDLLAFTRKLCGREDIHFNAKVAESEKRTSYNNAALINLMKSYGNIKNDIDVVLDFYFNLCSIEMTCRELAQSFAFLANYGVNPLNNEQVVSASKAKRINAIMQLCGFYDEAGEFSFKVGLPGKSGVGGGVIAVYPGKFSIALWSPKLNSKGNSYKAIEVLEFLTTKTQLSIF
ncbi:glutaminase [Thalassomonas viridans]|uniref:glutaminase n=1 Tax=Thalassomonas viridans TaxID=137584 RepID=UPI001F02CAFD|nr:glutaminase [Thalassomonas viridans]